MRFLPWTPALLIAAAFAALGPALEWAMARMRPDLPLYKRHLLAFFAVSLGGAACAWRLHPGPGFVLPWFADTAAGALGMSFISLSRLRARGRWVSHSWKRG